LLRLSVYNAHYAMFVCALSKGSLKQIFIRTKYRLRSNLMEKNKDFFYKTTEFFQQLDFYGYLALIVE